MYSGIFTLGARFGLALGPWLAPCRDRNVLDPRETHARALRTASHPDLPLLAGEHHRFGPRGLSDRPVASSAGGTLAEATFRLANNQQLNYSIHLRLCLDWLPNSMKPAAGPRRSLPRGSPPFSSFCRASPLTPHAMRSTQ